MKEIFKVIRTYCHSCGAYYPVVSGHQCSDTMITMEVRERLAKEIIQRTALQKEIATLKRIFLRKK